MIIIKEISGILTASSHVFLLYVYEDFDIDMIGGILNE